MKKVLYILFVVLVLVSCKTKKEKTEEESIERFNKTVAEIKEKHKVSNEKIVETKESVEEVEDNTVEERFYYFGKRFIDDSNLNPDYKCGNGMILYSKKENGSQIVIRKCEIKDISIGDLLRLQNRFIYESNSFGHEIGMLNDNDIVDVEEVCTVAYINQTSELWYKSNRQFSRIFPK